MVMVAVRGVCVCVCGGGGVGEWWEGGATLFLT